MEIALLHSHLKAIIDDEDYEKIKSYTWYLSSKGYAVARKGARTFQMHVLVCRYKWPDHKNRNKLDNRRENLRPSVNESLNQFNRDKFNKHKATSKYKGVCFEKTKSINNWICYYKRDIS